MFWKLLLFLGKYPGLSHQLIAIFRILLDGFHFVFRGIMLLLFSNIEFLGSLLFGLEGLDNALVTLRNACAQSVSDTRIGNVFTCLGERLLVLLIEFLLSKNLAVNWDFVNVALGHYLNFLAELTEGASVWHGGSDRYDEFLGHTWSNWAIGLLPDDKSFILSWLDLNSLTETVFVFDGHDYLSILTLANYTEFSCGWHDVDGSL